MKSPLITAGVVAAGALLWISEALPNESDKSPIPASGPMQGQKAGEVREHNDLKMKLVWCPPGKFKMGSRQTDKVAQDHE
jgi:hypothetical protein